MSRLTYRHDPRALGLGRRPHHFTQPVDDWEQSVRIERWCYGEFGRQDQKRGMEWHIRRGRIGEPDTFEFGCDTAATAFRLRWC